MLWPPLPRAEALFVADVKIAAAGGAVGLDVTEIWQRIAMRTERSVLELARLVAASFDRPLHADERQQGSDLCAALVAWFRGMRLSVAVDLVLQLQEAFGSDDVGPARAAACSALIEDLRTVLASTGVDAVPPRLDAPLVAVAGGSSAFTDSVLWLATQRGLRVADESMLSDDWAEPPRAVLVADADGDITELQSTVRAVRQRFGCAVIVNLDRDDLEIRAALARDATSIVADDSPLYTVTEIEAAVAAQLSAPVVAVFGEDRERVASELIAQGLTAEPCESMSDLLARARSNSMQAVVVGSDVELSVTALLRSDPRARHVAIISLADATGPWELKALDLFRAGADDVLPADVAADVLAGHCRNRLRRRRDLSAEQLHDEQPGSLSERHATLVIQRMLVAAHQRRAAVSVGLVRIESGNTSESEMIALADALAREFRRGDVVGRRGQNEFVVALNGVGRRTATRRFEDMLRNLGVGAEARAAVVEYPRDGNVLEDLVVAAGAVLDRARFEHGPRVISSDWSDGSTARTDVLIVDPDATLRALLSALFERNQLTVMQLNNGVSAVEYLTGNRDRVLPRVIVSELDLMGIDGFQLLRRLRDAGVLSQTRVLAVTSRVREADLVEALQLGASDVVTKPFSLALLMHRLLRVLES